MLNTITYAAMQRVNQCFSYIEEFCAIIYTENYDDIIDTINDTEKASDEEKNESELEHVFDGELHDGNTVFSYRLPYHYRQLANGKLVKCAGEDEEG